jgi:hypothetical protein
MARRDAGAGTGPRVRSRPLAFLGIVGAGLMATGVVLAVTGRPDEDPARPAPGPAPAVSVAAVGGDDRKARDTIADRPMASYPDAYATPGPVTTRDPGAPIVLPRCGRTGPAGVATGCPHTPQGAMAQLAAIDQAALASGTMAGARAVIAAWAQPGGPTTTSWTGIKAMAQLLSGTQAGAGGRLPLALTPMMGQFKGQVGADYVVPCIDFELDLTLAATARVAAADCQRMVWAGDRWMIGPGREPAPAPNLWPDTEAALDAGYRDLSWQ